MNGAMTLERFEQLADAYGGDVTRWPSDVRDGAAELMVLEPEATARRLQVAGDLDHVLDQWRAPAISAGLQAAVLAAAPRARAAWTRWIWGTGLGAGLVAAGAAGLMAGVVISGSLAPASDLEVVAAAASSYDELATALAGDV